MKKLKTPIPDVLIFEASIEEIIAESKFKLALSKQEVNKLHRLSEKIEVAAAMLDEYQLTIARRLERPRTYLDGAEELLFEPGPIDELIKDLNDEFGKLKEKDKVGYKDLEAEERITILIDNADSLTMKEEVDELKNIKDELIDGSECGPELKATRKGVFGRTQ